MDCIAPDTHTPPPARVLEREVQNRIFRRRRYWERTASGGAAVLRAAAPFHFLPQPPRKCQAMSPARFLIALIGLNVALIAVVILGADVEDKETEADPSVDRWIAIDAGPEVAAWTWPARFDPTIEYEDIDAPPQPKRKLSRDPRSMRKSAFSWSASGGLIVFWIEGSLPQHFGIAPSA